MSIQVTLDLPSDLLERLQHESADLQADVKEAFLLDLFRRGKLTHFELSQALGLDRFETDAYLKKHNVYEGSLTMEDLENDRKTLEELFGKAS
jgi:hypothetical protein